MTRIPSFEEVLNEIHQGLGLKRDPRKGRFLALDMELDGHVELAAKLMKEMHDALGLDEPAQIDARRNATEFAGFHKAVELRTWTFNASQQQVLWHLLAYSYVPAFARRLAFWTLDNAEADAPTLDAGMPGGKFWFLPVWEKDENRIDMPLNQVLDWLLDLLDASSIRAMQGNVGNKHVRAEDGESVIRTLNNWRSGSIPKNASKIAEVFPDDATLEFTGAFVHDGSLSEDLQFQAALDFVHKKKLDTPSRLRQEIPMTEARLTLLLMGNAPDEEKREFVKLLAERYVAPEMAVVRRRLQVARLMQDGYMRLLEYLCPGVAPDCADPAKNKLLQLIGLFGTIYNLTIEAWQHGSTAEEQDAYFESRLPPWAKADLLLSILPSLNAGPKHELFAERLSRIFMALTLDSPLEDLVPLTEDEAIPVIDRRLQRIRRFAGEDARLKRLVERVRVASPWRALQEETSYWVVMQFLQRLDLTPKIRDMALGRLRSLAGTGGQQVAVAMLGALFLLNAAKQERPKDIQAKVQFLLDDAERNPGYEEWKAPLLRLRAKHRLFQNDLAGAKADFDAALDACDERAFGPVRGEIAREAFAVTIAHAGLNPQNDKGYHRQMLAYSEFPNGWPTFEDAAAECEEFFWSELYRPYPGVERTEGPATIQYKSLFKETCPIIEQADWDGLRVWLKAHAKKFNRSLKDARRNSILLAWMKMSLFLRSGMRANIRSAFDILLGAWPEQAKIADFKGQTPLMLAANCGDAELVRLLAPLSDADAQDYLGRTPLHAAAAGRSPECVKHIQERQPHVADRVTVGERNTVLHTAVRFGVPETVQLIAEEFPSLLNQANASGQTPLDMAREILDDHPEWSSYMRLHGRNTGTIDDFGYIVELLTPFEEFTVSST